ncbi:prolipoprotein diacylglyceryl transferase [Cellvibrio fibrivorans]|uniref:Phosphatidylglycerol--prolipoprotein diacylglyceryl transferase n=1 Tax=Cellvibrio fibrivorans TaxID=126350 RepID=A0ABU1US98_9GAMM|nr:prolipoprotein diacylglyceryl transferase family protein [Cellvibrio fibrivorans]MDR7088065.1 phosphatidylglycerol:prolipoprotein diacylglycerol transferase [Cellvibrio fibrivorans]
MSYPYLSDLINHLFGTNIQLPIAMFGAFVALAIITAAWVGKKEVMRFERLGKLPSTVISGNKSITTHLLVSDLAMICAIFGVIGAHIFHLLEYPRELLQDPIAMIFSLDGLSIYGGLILGAIAGAIFLNKRAVPIIPMLDALAPSIILGYGIGRLGCQVSGDGDWGTAANMAIKPNWLPDWFWTQTYENNVVGTIIPAPGVYPTPLYEALAAFLIFAFLWSIRKTHYKTGFLFSVYLLLSGFERLLIEKIRINSEYHLWGMNFTQAEFISTALIIAGVVGIIKTTNARLLPRIVFSVVVIGALSACAQL